jgi:hypothetical protein
MATPKASTKNANAAGTQAGVDGDVFIPPH